LLDGEAVRGGLSRDLGFSKADRETHLRRLTVLAKRRIRRGGVAIVAAITPYRNIRGEVRTEIGDLLVVYLNCPLQVCIERDPKGLYRKALAGQIKHFTGLDAPYEPPVRPNIEIRTNEESPEESLARIIRVLEMLNWLPPEAKEGLSDEEAELIRRRLIDLGYL